MNDSSLGASPTSPTPLPATRPATRGPARNGARRITRRAAHAGLAGSLPIIALACGSSAPEAQPATATTEAPTAAPTVAPTPEPTPEPTPTPVPYHPLTGRQVQDPSTVRRRIVAAKIDNAPPARPQFGLGAAEVVYEQLAEGGLTRFLAFFLAQEPERVGPVRSARLTDIYLGQEWEFLLAYAGAGRTTSRMLAEALIPLFKAPELGERLQGTPYFRDNNRPIPNNMFVKVADVRAAALNEPGLAPEVEIRPFPFHEPPAEAGPLRAINLPYVPAAAVTWRYDSGAGVWRRVMAGVPHVDALSNQQIGVENVGIQYARIFTAQNVETDSAGNPVLDTVLRGENRFRLFHSGQMFEGKWVKEHDRAKTQYLLPDGNPLPFRPGRTWIHIVPTDFGASWSA